MIQEIVKVIVPNETNTKIQNASGLTTREYLKTMKSKFIITLFFIFLLTGCSIKMKEPNNSKFAIQWEIANLTDIHLDTTKFTVLVDSVHNTEGAIDLDYTWYISIQFDNSYFENLKTVIRSSANFDSVRHQFDQSWGSFDSAKVKGVWHLDSTLFEFVQKPMQFNPEPIQLSIDTLTRTLDLKLIHL